MQSRSLFVTTGLMLFALFFGAGNLVFPAQLGQLAGENMWLTTLGFVVTGAGLPLLGIAAMAYSGAKDVEVLASRVHPIFGLCFAVMLYLAIGPLFATPRTATVSFEIGVVPFLAEGVNKDWALAIFSLLFFGLTYWLAMSPSKLLDRIGKWLTPALLISITVLTATTMIKPMGSLQAAQGPYITHPFIQGFLDGYQTMDALASLVFSIIVISTLQQAGVTQVKRLMKMTFGAGILSSLCLAVVYVMVAYLGASSVMQIGLQDNGAAVLSGVAEFYWGTAGNILLLVIVLLACLSTAVGLIVACAQYFNRVFAQLSYQQFVIVFTVVSCLLANKGLSGIISLAVPVLMLLYPLTVVLICLTFLDKMFASKQLVYVMTMMMTLLMGLLDAWKTAFGLPGGIADFLSTYVPFYEIGMAWVVPVLITFILSIVVSKWR